MLICHSALYKGSIFHLRKYPVKNTFQYPMYLFAIDLEKLNELNQSKLMGVNQIGFFSFWDEDHLKFWEKEYGSEKVEPGASKLSERIRNYLATQIPMLEVSKIILLTNLRIFGYVFNPVSFYYIFEKVDNKDELKCILAEVNNTFGEQRLFLVEDIDKVNEAKKMFYVSPFVPFDANFYFRFSRLGERLSIQIDSMQGNKLEVRAVLTGFKETISDIKLLKNLIVFPFYTIFIILRIHWQALKLFIKKVPYFGKDETDEKIKEYRAQSHSKKIENGTF